MGFNSGFKGLIFIDISNSDAFYALHNYTRRYLWVLTSLKFAGKPALHNCFFRNCTLSSWTLPLLMNLQNFHTTFPSIFFFWFLAELFIGFMGWKSNMNKGFFRLICQLKSVVHSGNYNRNYFWRMRSKKLLTHLQSPAFLFVCLLIFCQQIYVTVHIIVITLYFVWYIYIYIYIYILLSLKYFPVLYSYLMPLIFIRTRRSCSNWSEVCWILCVWLCDFTRLTLLLQLAIQAAFQSFTQAAPSSGDRLKCLLRLGFAVCAEWGIVFSV